MRPALSLSVLLALATLAPAYIHVPPQTLKAMCDDSRQIRVLTVKSRDRDKGGVVFDIAETLRDKDKSPVRAFRLLVRPDAANAKAVLDKLAVGSTVVLFSQEYLQGKNATGYGYAFIDDLAFSVDYNSQAELWLHLRAEPGLSAAYHGPARDLPDLVKAILAGKTVKVPTRKPEKDDLSIRGLIVEEARRLNSPTHPKAPLPTAWGKPVKGLQAGVRINPAVEVADAPVVLEVVVRNVDTKPRTFTHLQLAFAGTAADGTVTGKAEEYASRFMPKGSRMGALVSPGNAYPIAAVPLFRAGGGKDWKLPRLTLSPGVTRVGLEDVAVRLGSGSKGDDVELATGYLDVTLPAADARHQLEYAPAPVDNPLKGLVPYAGDHTGRFPHSLEFDYLPLSDLVTGPDRYDWAPLDRLLDAVAGRGHQAVFRVYVEFPNKADGIPAYLLADKLKVHTYRDETAKPPTTHVTPDYADPRFQKALTSFVAALGKRYDGDPRIGFITAGLLGYWGEWHTYPKSDLFADKRLQADVLDAYEAAFKATPVLLRYPVGKGHPQLAPNVGRRFGYHDDSFAWGTLDTGRKDDEWFFMPSLKAAGPQALAAWKTRPIGGEIRPEAWGIVFDERPARKEVQDFRRCVEQTHVSWLMDSGMFEPKQPAGRVKRAEDAVRRMGYEFYAPAATLGLTAGKLAVAVELENRGVAPFYHDWPAEFALLAGGKAVKTWTGDGKLTGLLPGDPARTWKATLDVAGLPAGAYKVGVRVPNPLPRGNPVRFANKSQDADVAGWLTLGPIDLH